MTFKQLAKGQGRRLYPTQEEEDMLRKILKNQPPSPLGGTNIPPTLPEIHPAACTTHCYCQSITIGVVPHEACCMCGHRRVQNSFSFRDIQRADGKTFG